MLKRILKGQRGFTLVELVVVTAIMGVLASVATPLMVNHLPGANEEAYNADLGIIQAAVDAWYYFVDIAALVNAGFLREISKSSSLDNSPTGAGSYTYYVDNKGQVQTALSPPSRASGPLRRASTHSKEPNSPNSLPTVAASG